MKPCTIVLLAACSLVAMAEEPPAPVPAPAMDQLKRLQPQQSVQPPAIGLSGSNTAQSFAAAGAAARDPNATCYFIRTIRPVSADPGILFKGFIPLQAVQNAPDSDDKAAATLQWVQAVPAQEQSQQFIERTLEKQRTQAVNEGCVPGSLVFHGTVSVPAETPAWIIQFFVACNDAITPVLV